ncbi:restriction endonuclease subunit S [Halomonas icarae]|uniref:Restriction endonuclease subunit S n=1 Tax=Halomonas icarae TaxID=2691040 RepID=A0A7X5AML7_9GAMM|nr:restriction endonuclease subunit S [Halomonas icarae]MDR5901640.1 restriction endonuclease subunit S [Halomonas icarae]NAW12989.1 restriction endonuclease subunit S [Halomonas icarae]
MSQWKKLKLPECLDKAPKATKIPKRKFLQSGLYPIVSQEKGLVNGRWDDPRDVVRIDSPIIVFGDHTTVLKLVDFDFVVGADGVKILNPKPFLDAGYLYCYLLGRPLSGLGYARHYRLLKEVEVDVPSLEEQKRIVAILDEAFEGIDTVVANTEKNLVNVHELFTSFLGKAFEEVKNIYGEVRIDSACDSVIDCINKTAPKVDEPTPYKMIRTTNVRNGFVNLEAVKYVTEEVYEKWTRRQVPISGDVILTREAPMGEVGILDTEEKVFLGQRLVSYRADRKKLLPDFLIYAFQSPYMQRQIHSFASGSTVQHMRVPDCKKLMLPLPDLDKQWKIVERLTFIRAEVSRVESTYQQKLTALTELKQSLLQKAFSGELTASEAEAAVEEATA